MTRNNTYLSTYKQLETTETQLANIKKTKENTILSTNKQIEITKTQLENIRKTKANALVTTQESLKSAQISVDLASKSLENSKTNLANFEKNSVETLKTLNDKKTGLLDSTRVSIENSLVTLNSSITQADLLLGITTQNKNANDAYETYL